MPGEWILAADPGTSDAAGHDVVSAGRMGVDDVHAGDGHAASLLRQAVMRMGRRLASG